MIAEKRDHTISTETPESIRARYGPSHCRGFHTIIDPAIGRVRIIEECSARGPLEWDAVNRHRAQGALISHRLDGTTLIMDAVLDTVDTVNRGSETAGEDEEGDATREVRFGPASSETGGQALISATLSDDGKQVRTRWKGIAGASVGVGACLAACKDVTDVEYRDFTGIGGSHTVDVTLTTPALTRLVFGIDDTDNKEKGATWALAFRLSAELERQHGAKFLDLRVVQLCPLVPEKTTNCVAIALSVALPVGSVNAARRTALSYVKEQSLSDDTGMAILEGLHIPEAVIAYSDNAKRHVRTVAEAQRVAQNTGVDLMPVTGERGMIGALAAIGFCERPEAAMLYSDYADEEEK